MTTLQEESNRQSDASNDINSMETDTDINNALEVDLGLYFLQDGVMNVAFTGYFNGVGVEVNSHDAIAINNMGCFGKGSASRSKPRRPESGVIQMIRRRQFHKRNKWYKMYSKNKSYLDADKLFACIKDFSYELKDSTQKDVVDLVSSDEEYNDDTTENTNNNDIAVVVPNSDSEGDDYFANLKPKYCYNKIILEEKLMLTMQEAFFLSYGLGCLQVSYSSNTLSVEECWKLFTDNDPKFIEKYVVYHYFRSKGYIVKPGIKFGGDYLLYREGPEVNHADYIVVIRFNDNNFDWTSILGHVRMANTTSKQVLIAEVIKSKKINLQLPQDLSEYSVREVLLDRNIPVTINEDID